MRLPSNEIQPNACCRDESFKRSVELVDDTQHRIAFATDITHHARVTSYSSPAEIPGYQLLFSRNSDSAVTTSAAEPAAPPSGTAGIGYQSVADDAEMLEVHVGRLDGRLVGVPHRQTFRDLNPDQHGLVPLEQEIFMGFIFVRLEPGLPSVREMLAPYIEELAAYRLEELVPQGRVTLRPRNVNWKNVADNYSDGMHIDVAHPGLTRLFGRSYGIEAQPWADKMWGLLQEAPSRNWSERLYQKLLPGVEHLPPETLVLNSHSSPRTPVSRLAKYAASPECQGLS